MSSVAGQNVKNKCMLSQLCYVYVEVNTYDLDHIFYLAASLQV